MGGPEGQPLKTGLRLLLGVWVGQQNTGFGAGDQDQMIKLGIAIGVKGITDAIALTLSLIHIFRRFLLVGGLGQMINLKKRLNIARRGLSFGT